VSALTTPRKARRIRQRLPGPHLLPLRLWAALDTAHGLLSEPDPALRLAAVQAIGVAGGVLHTVLAGEAEKVEHDGR
jgi:hypothetical protein